MLTLPRKRSFLMLLDSLINCFLTELFHPLDHNLLNQFHKSRLDVICNVKDILSQVVGHIRVASLSQHNCDVLNISVPDCKHYRSFQCFRKNVFVQLNPRSEKNCKCILVSCYRCVMKSCPACIVLNSNIGSQSCKTRQNVAISNMRTCK